MDQKHKIVIQSWLGPLLTFDLLPDDNWWLPSYDVERSREVQYIFGQEKANHKQEISYSSRHP